MTKNFHIKLVNFFNSRCFYNISGTDECRFLNDRVRE